MNTDFLLNFLIGFLSASLVGFGLFWYYFTQKVGSLKYRYNSMLRESEEENRVMRNELYALRINHAKLEENHQSLIRELDRAENNKDQMRLEFENIAQHVLEQSSQKMQATNHQTLSHVLEPFKENIKQFNEKIENYYRDEVKERFSLTKEIEKLYSLNQQISKDAINLTNALKGDSKMQGDWGEYILERVLENSGLTKGREYEIQQEFRDRHGNRLRPDVIVHLPDSKDVIIDSKLSLNAYERYHNSDDVVAREEALQAHLQSINTHIKQLSNKNYQKLDKINTLDFVLMFIPIEAAFLLAVEKDNHLYERAYTQNIILVSPSTLLAVLRTIQNSWRYEYQNKNAELIAKKAGDMYDKFVAFVDEMQMVEKSLIKAQQSYESAFKKLSSGKGNLITRSKQLKELDGVYYHKETNEII